MSPEHSKPSIAIFGGEYNAKGRPLAEIVRTFVPPLPTFSKLIKPDNTLLIGPRGSGKTTLMKMLQGPALEQFAHPEADAIRAAVDYTAVLVPGDQSWGKQLEALQLDAIDGARFAVAVFTLHCLRALVRAASERTGPPSGDVGQRRVILPAVEIEGIARAVAAAWMIRQPVADLDDLSEVLSDSISQLSQLRSRVEHMTEAERAAAVAGEPLLHLDLIPAARSLVERFNRVCGEREGRWAFLFDEAELVPSVINELIFRLLRGTDELFLFKVSYAPYENLDIELGPHGPQEANDFTTLRLTYANKREGFPFTEALFHARLRASGIDATPLQVLGKPTVVTLDPDASPETSEEEPAGPASAYSPESAYGEMLAELARIDETFVEWLTRNGLELEHAHELPEDKRARLRKVMPIVALRLAWRRDPERAEEGQPIALRGRRNVTLYSGTDAFYAMMEANPRWLQHTCDRLLIPGDPRRIAPERQSRHLGAVAAEFESYLRILPVRHMAEDDGPKRLLGRIGRYFREHYVRGPFNADAYGSFVVDLDPPDAIVNSLRALVNRGAVIEVPGNKGAGLHGLRGKRFRPAYIMAPRYGLPLRLDNEVGLSKILGIRRRAPRKRPAAGQEKLREDW